MERLEVLKLDIQRAGPAVLTLMNKHKLKDELLAIIDMAISSIIATKGLEDLSKDASYDQMENGWLVTRIEKILKESGHAGQD